MDTYGANRALLSGDTPRNILAQRNRVPEYWLIDDRAQLVERWRPEDDRPEIVSEQLEWRPEGAREPFVLDLPKFFAEFLPEDD